MDTTAWLGYTSSSSRYPLDILIIQAVSKVPFLRPEIYNTLLLVFVYMWVCVCVWLVRTSPSGLTIRETSNLNFEFISVCIQSSRNPAVRPAGSLLCVCCIKLLIHHLMLADTVVACLIHIPLFVWPGLVFIWDKWRCGSTLCESSCLGLCRRRDTLRNNT